MTVFSEVAAIKGFLFLESMALAVRGIAFGVQVSIPCLCNGYQKKDG
jgi:hypothetical protein